jgi:hypothetical protein
MPQDTAAMLITYWIYHLDWEEQFLKGEVFDAVSDAEALLRVQANERGHVVEVWAKDRLVTRIGPDKH